MDGKNFVSERILFSLNSFHGVDPASISTKLFVLLLAILPGGIFVPLAFHLKKIQNPVNERNAR